MVLGENPESRISRCRIRQRISKILTGVRMKLTLTTKVSDQVIRLQHEIILQAFFIHFHLPFEMLNFRVTK